jgi:nucleotide-binding universal stress UspA family protein
MSSPILAAVDFTPAGRAAFDHAVAHSRARRAPLVAITAVPANEPFRWRGSERRDLFDELQRTADESGVELEVSVQQGDPSGVILLHAHARQPQLIVIGTQERSRLGRLRAASVAERVTLSATSPVLIVPSSTAGPALAGRSLDRLIVGVDFGAAGTRALDEAVTIGAEANGRVTLVHVLPGAASGAIGDPRVGMLEYHNVLLRRDAWRGLNAMIAERPCVAAHLQPVVTSGDAATELGRIARDSDADLVVVGVTSRGFVGRRLFGATAARLMRKAGRPVLAVPERARRAWTWVSADRDRLAA